jgi:hypothetical protein
MLEYRGCIKRISELTLTWKDESCAMRSVRSLLAYDRHSAGGGAHVFRNESLNVRHLVTDKGAKKRDSI